MAAISFKEGVVLRYDRWMIERIHRRMLGSVSIDNPKTFHDKIARKILYDPNPLVPYTADKVTARHYIADKVGAAYLPTLHGIFDRLEDIDVAALPQSFVMKASHGSGMNIIVRDKARWDFAKASNKLRDWLGYNYYWMARERPYRHIRPRIIVEELLLDERGEIPRDFKIAVVNGTAINVGIDFDRHTNHTRNVYNRDLKLEPYALLWKQYTGPVEFPANIEEMFRIAEVVGGDFDFVRIDLYNVKGRIYIGELTSLPGAGIETFDPPEYAARYCADWKPQY